MLKPKSICYNLSLVLFLGSVINYNRIFYRNRKQIKDAFSKNKKKIENILNFFDKTPIAVKKEFIHKTASYC